MKKSKFLKTLAAIAVGAVAAVGAISFAACGGGEEADPGNGTENSGTENPGNNPGNTPGNDPGSNIGTNPGSTPTAHNCSYSWEALTTAAGYSTNATQKDTDKLTLTAANFSGENAFITVIDASTLTWRCYKQAKGAFEMKGAGISVTFQGTGTLSVSFCSTGGDNISGFALVQPDGTWVKATSTTATELAADETIATDYVNKAGLYTVKGTSATSVSYTISTPGTYKFYSSYSYIDAKDGKAKNRGCRISGITMSDTY